MANLSTEQSSYILAQQQYTADVKVGQFAKFLNKNPIYVTYYALNHANSRADAGSGAVYEEIGEKSPLRFNKILQLPAFNFPELKPDVSMDEGGYNIDMDINDIAFIAGTIRPKPGDYMLVELPRTMPLLFRCNMYRHNTIQSNDYYMGDFDLVDINQSYVKLIEKQVEEVYTCNFANIGTNQKVFMSEVEMNQINDLNGLIDILTTFYNDAFWNPDIEGFVLYDASAIDIGSSPRNGIGIGTQYYVDNYLTRFITESKIFQRDDSDYTIVLSYPELLPLNFDYVYRRTIWNAVLQRTNDYLNVYTYAWSRMLQKRVSPLMLASIPTLHPTVEIFDHYVQPEYASPKELEHIIPRPGGVCGWSGYDPMLRPYFSLALSKSISSGVQDLELNPVELIIYQYIKKGIDGVSFKRKDLINFSFQHDMFTFMHMPIIIYILKQQLSSLSTAS